MPERSPTCGECGAPLCGDCGECHAHAEPETFECSTCGGRFAMERRAGGQASDCIDCDAVDPDRDDHDMACDSARDEAREPLDDRGPW